MDDVTAFKTLEPVVDHAIRVVGSGIEIFGVLIIVTGIAWSTFRQLLQRISDQDSEVYKIRIGRSLLLGLQLALGRRTELTRDSRARGRPTQRCRATFLAQVGKSERE